jgi:hypothetical protein
MKRLARSQDAYMLKSLNKRRRRRKVKDAESAMKTFLR